ncbi:MULTISPECIES: hypothetical protein [Phytobacter]|uniref:Immunity protein 8 of polymorphic toxin system n=1 Tax=Phytobacter diazotrophicus TaxID=395631 RepID=A0ABN6LKV9_9ENTR|nr:MULTISPECIES: hypothetical protein [Phytobacter]MDU4150233.1 hypothetical protein [Enterobacteriaceae bacterium]MDU7377354.1 hypothetical protein [Enterobacteriaceae bacterium]BBE76353.1 hypothetical protein MRY16398_14090 [Phytobacter sp. MRY16-398]BDD49821.1 hypothetical protein PDTA9734_13080 [Phytobacter diazotrophicus]BEG80852.1 hypothetical protein PDTA9730_13080 [Phytobacter diazotrophicus]
MQPVCLMGDGYEPHVAQLGEQLSYSLPVDSGFVSFSFTFTICQADLDVLLSDDYRRAVLEVIAHTLLQRSTLPGNTHFTQSEFDSLVADTLHSTRDFLEAFIAKISQENHIVIEKYVHDILNRRLNTK